MSTNLDRCLAYIAKLPGALSGSGGHNATLRAACECVRFGLTDSEALQALAEFNRRCAPPWSERELAHKLDSARKLAGTRAGTRGGPTRRTRPGAGPIGLDNLPKLRPVASNPTPGNAERKPVVAIKGPEWIPESIRQFAAEVGAVIEVLR